MSINVFLTYLNAHLNQINFFKMKNALKIKLALVLYIIYWWLTLTFWNSPDLYKNIKFTLDNIWIISTNLILLLVCTSYPIVRYVAFLVDYTLGLPNHNSKEAQERYFESLDHIFAGVCMSGLIWTPTFITYKLSSHPPLDSFPVIGFCKFFIVAFLFYCIDELLVEVLKKRLPKSDS